MSDTAEVFTAYGIQVEVVTGYGMQWDAKAGNAMPAKIKVLGRYERVGSNFWCLRAWRLQFCSSLGMEQGQWHRVHGNQKKDIGGAKLVADDRWISERERP